MFVFGCEKKDLQRVYIEEEAMGGKGKTNNNNNVYSKKAEKKILSKLEKPETRNQKHQKRGWQRKNKQLEKNEKKGRNGKERVPLFLFLFFF